MSSAVLQLLALATMVVDHVGLSLFPGEGWLRWVGRLSFPLFVFLLCEGFVHTSSRRKYALRLGMFALLSEVPYQLLMGQVYGESWGWPVGNIFFELLCCFFALWCVERGGLWIFVTAGLALAAQLLGLSYGAYGVVLAVCFFLFRGKPWLQGIALVGATCLYCVYYSNWVQGWAMLAAVPLALYNGQRGRRLPRYFLYGFYPLHLAALAGALWLLAVPGV